MRRAATAIVGLILAGYGGPILAQDRPVTGVVLTDDSRASVLRVDEVQTVSPGGNDSRASESAGRGIIRGVVTSAVTGAPVRGATVRALFGSGDAGPRTAVTDDNGAFEFSGLPAGSWRVTASKSGFVSRSFGQRGPSGSGSFLSVNGRDVVAASIALLRGGAIVGHVFDEFGDPAVGVRVQAMKFEASDNGRRLVPAGVPDISDDTGAFRVYGLLPGDYLVSGRAPTAFDGDHVMVDRIEAKLFAIAGATGARAVSVPRNRVSTFFPGTADLSVAEAIAIGPGDERTGVDFALTNVTPFRVTGTVVNSSGERPSGSVIVSLNADSPSLSGLGDSLVMSGPTVNGTFDFRDVPPGSYVLSVSIPGARLEVAEAPVRVADDVIGLEVVTAPSVSLTGTVISDGGTLPVLRGMTVRARPLRALPRAFSATAGAVIDEVFQVPNLLGPVRLGVERVPAGWMLKAIEVDGVDVTDTPITFMPGQRPYATIVLTNRLTELSGTVTHEGRPLDADVAIFPDDPATWGSTRFVRWLRADSRGMFSMRGMPPHDRYLAIAAEYLEESELREPEFLERLRSRATPFSLDEGQSRRISLTVVERSAIDGR